LDNMHFNGLSSINIPNYRVVALAEDVPVVESGYMGTQVSQPVSCFDLNESTATLDHISEMHYGEEPLSFRALLKRFVSGPFAVVAAAAANSTYLSLSGPIYPDNRMPLLGAPQFRPDLFSYLRLAYLGVRGGMRWRFHLAGPIGDGVCSNTKASLTPPSFLILPFSVNPWAGSGNSAPSNLEGTVAHVLHTNGGVEVEFPMYSPNLFQLPMSDTWDSGTTTGNMEGTWFRDFQVVFEGVGSLVANVLSTEFATAEDFHFIRFQGAVPYSR